MKKLTLTAVSVLAIAAAGANAKNFDGFNAGVRAKYNWANHEVKFTDTTLKATSKPKGVSGDLVLGYLHNMDNGLVLGLEGFAGWANYEGKGKVDESDAYTLQKTYSMGLDFLAGYTFMPELLGYGKVGVHGTKNKFKVSDDGDAALNYNKVIPEFALGAGVKYELSNDVSLDLGYTYAIDLHKYEFRSGGVKIAETDGAHTHTIHVGVSYQF